MVGCHSEMLMLVFQPSRFFLRCAVGSLIAIGMYSVDVRAADDGLDIFGSPAGAKDGESTAAAPAVKKAPPVTPGSNDRRAAKAGALPLTKEEEDAKAEVARKREEWIKGYCTRAKGDPQCQFHLKKKLFESMRKMQRSERASMTTEEYCEVNKNDKECVEREGKEERAHLRQVMKEIRDYCRVNPSSERCELYFMKEELGEQGAKETNEPDENTLEQVHKLTRPPSGGASQDEVYGDSTLFESDGGY